MHIQWKAKRKLICSTYVLWNGQRFLTKRPLHTWHSNIQAPLWLEDFHVHIIASPLLCSHFTHVFPQSPSFHVIWGICQPPTLTRTSSLVPPKKTLFSSDTGKHAECALQWGRLLSCLRRGTAAGLHISGFMLQSIHAAEMMGGGERREKPTHHKRKLEETLRTQVWSQIRWVQIEFQEQWEMALGLAGPVEFCCVSFVYADAFNDIHMYSSPSTLKH